jgi:hypothetical protein
MKNQINLLKQELKSLAKEITTNRKLYKQAQREGKSLWNIRVPSYEFRYKHIVYCMLRGRTIEQIERSHKPGKEPNMPYIEMMIKKVQDEALRSSEIGSVEIPTSSSSGSRSCGAPAEATTAKVEEWDTGLLKGKGFRIFGAFKSLFR